MIASAPSPWRHFSRSGMGRGPRTARCTGPHGHPRREFIFPRAALGAAEEKIVLVDRMANLVRVRVEEGAGEVGDTALLSVDVLGFGVLEVRPAPRLCTPPASRLARTAAQDGVGGALAPLPVDRYSSRARPVTGAELALLACGVGQRAAAAAAAGYPPCDARTCELLEQADALRVQAADRGDYSTAAALTAFLHRCGRAGVAIARVEGRKRAAVRRQDFEDARRCTAEEDRLMVRAALPPRRGDTGARSVRGVCVCVCACAGAADSSPLPGQA